MVILFGLCDLSFGYSFSQVITSIVSTGGVFNVSLDPIGASLIDSVLHDALYIDVKQVDGSVLLHYQSQVASVHQSCQREDHFQAFQVTYFFSPIL